MEIHYGIFLTHTPPPFSISVWEKILFLLEINSNLARARDWQSCQSCLTGVTSMSVAPIEGALPIPIWRILTPGTILYIWLGSQRYSSTSRSLLVSSEAIKIASDDRIWTAFYEKSGRRIRPNHYKILAIGETPLSATCHEKKSKLN